MSEFDSESGRRGFFRDVMRRISFLAGNLDMGPKVVSFRHRTPGSWPGLQFWRIHAQASSGDLQPRAGAASHSERPHRFTA